jgi:hypothetical protein
MMLRGENRSTRRKICPNTTFSTTNFTRKEFVPKPGLGGEGLATKLPEPWHGPLKTKINPNYIKDAARTA